MRNKRIQSMAVSAILIAIIALMTFVPYVGYLTIPGTPISICTIHVVVLLAALLFGWKQGLVAGTAFGVLCLLKAIIMPTSPTDVLFINPMVSVLPRMIFGALSGLVFDFLKRIRNIPFRSVMYIIACVFCTLIHTALVLSALWFFNKEFSSSAFMLVFGSVLSINAVIEVISAAILAPGLALAIGKAKKKYNPYVVDEKLDRITATSLIFLIIIIVQAVMIIFAKTWMSLLPLIVTIIFVITREIIRKKEKKNE